MGESGSPKARSVPAGGGLDRGRRRREKGNMDTQNDERTMANLMRQYERLEKVKNALIRQGILDGSAKPSDVEAALRRMIPADLFP